MGEVGEKEKTREEQEEELDRNMWAPQEEEEDIEKDKEVSPKLFVASGYHGNS